MSFLDVFADYLRTRLDFDIQILPSYSHYKGKRIEIKPMSGWFIDLTEVEETTNVYGDPLTLDGNGNQVAIVPANPKKRIVARAALRIAVNYVAIGAENETFRDDCLNDSLNLCFKFKDNLKVNMPQYNKTLLNKIRTVNPDFEPDEDSNCWPHFIVALERKEENDIAFQTEEGDDGNTGETFFRCNFEGHIIIENCAGELI